MVGYNALIRRLFYKEEHKMSVINSMFTRDKVKGIVSIVAAGIMYFTPDHIDRIIEGLLAAFGVSQFILQKKDNG